jgi:hypothetical protein
MSGNDDFREDVQAPDEENARRFFGFAPQENLDVFTLRARKMKREDEARNAQDRERAQRYFDVLAPAVGLAVTPRCQPESGSRAAPPTRKIPTSDGERCGPSPAGAVASVLHQLRGQLDYALRTEVIQHTIVAYNNLFNTLVSLASLLGVDPSAVGNAWVRSHMRPPARQLASRSQLEEVVDLIPEGLHVSLGGTPEFNHPHHRYIAHAPEARLGLQFEPILTAIRDKAEEILAGEPTAQWFFP